MGKLFSVGVFWENWDRQQVCKLLDYSVPETEAELVQIVKSANEKGQKVKAVAAGHSFSSIALTQGHMVSLDKLNKIVSVNGTDVVVQAGIRLYDLNSQLEKLGLSLENLGATCEQSLAGATATGTHGTGRLLGSMSTQILSFRMVKADGSIITANSNENINIFKAGRVGLGGLGIITEITIRTLPLFKLKLTNSVLSLTALIEELPSLMAAHERLQWFWLPYDVDHAQLVIREVTDEPITPGGCWNTETHFGEPSQFFEKFGITSNTTSASSCVDVSYKALCGSQEHYLRRSLYTEMEMFVPIDKVIDAIKEFREFQDSVRKEHNSSIRLFTGVRYVAADDIVLSPQTGKDGGRNNAVISMIVMGNSPNITGDPTEFARYAQRLEQICQEKYDGRPHWGKQNWANSTSLQHSYNQNWDTFVDLRKSLDPKGMFLNSYLENRL